MNWYKNIIFSSRNLKLPEGTEEQVRGIVDKIIISLQNLQNLPEDPILIGQINFINPYNKQNSLSNIYLNNKTVEETGNTVAMRDRQTGDIYLNIYKAFLLSHKNLIDINYTKKILKEHLFHELTHSIDPKIINLNKTYDMYEYDKPTEFDAYSREITNYINTAYKSEENQALLKRYMVSNSFGEPLDDIINILNMPINLFFIIKYWKENNPKYIKQLRQRIFNEVIIANS